MTKLITLLEPNVEEAIALQKVLKARFPLARIEIFSEGRQAYRAFTAQVPHIIITELILADDDALWLIKKALTDFKESTFFVISEFPALEDLAANFAAYNNVHFVKKPFDYSKFTEAIQAASVRIPDSILAGINLQTVLQMIQLDLKSCYLELVSSHGSGFLCFEEGYIFHASFLTYTGEIAFAEILKVPIEVIRVFEGHFKAEKNIEVPLLKLLLTHCQSEDEIGAIERKVVNYG
jgi:hypothetical protein